MRIIESLRTKNCGALGTRTFSFTEGFNIVRGPNEAGKSTVLEALGICFFGSSAMRGTWEDLVTTGEKVGSLSLNLKFGEYTIHRSKSSASVVSDDGKIKISGHGEVNEFFLNMFGLKKGTENHIMIAKQGEIQGILESGATDATKFIEGLAGFEQIDELVGSMKVEYPVTDKQALEQQLLSLETKLETKLSEELPDVEKNKLTLQKKQAVLTGVTDKLSARRALLEVKSAALDELKEQLGAFKEASARVKSQEQLISDLEMNRTGLIKQVSLIEAEADASQERLKSAEVFLSGLSAQQTAYHNYEKVKNFVSCQYTWDEDLQSLYAEVEKTNSEIIVLEAEVKAAEKEVTKLESSSITSEQLEKLQKRRDMITQERAVLKAMTEDSAEISAIRAWLDENYTNQSVARSKIIQETTCPTCGTDLSEKAAKINEETGKELQKLESEQRVLEDKLEEAIQDQLDARSQQEKELLHEYNNLLMKIDSTILVLEKSTRNRIAELEAYNERRAGTIADKKETLSAMELIRDKQKQVTSILNEVGEVEVIVDRTVFPWTMSWAGDIPTKPAQQQIDNAHNDVVYCRGLVTSLKEKKEQFDKACADITFAKSRLIQLQQELNEQLDTTEDIDLILADINSVKTSINQLTIDQENAAAESNAAATQLAMDQQVITTHTKAVEEIKADMAEVSKTLLASAENNALHRAVAEARGVVVESVWNRLFAVTNECFSQIRGTASDITRDGKVFRVNGTKTVRLSGSTLDSLGLAMRSAIRDIFAPTTDFMFLDEIAAGMDPDRTAAAMAQVATLIVGQKILVTHENVSDSLADNIIEV